MAVIENRSFIDKDGPYLLPNDSPEHDRLDAQGASVTALLNNKPFRAPVSNPKKILDIGCGTGLTTLHLAKLFPSAQVIGIDLSPVPTARLGKSLPKNLFFIQGDIKTLIVSAQEPFQPNSFDYIYQRFLLLGMTDWPSYIPALTTLLRPGCGWLECQDPSMKLLDDREERVGAHLGFYEEFLKDSEAMGLDIEIGEHLKGIFGGTGVLEDIEVDLFRISPVAREEFPERAVLEGQLKGIHHFLLARVFERTRDQEFRSRAGQEVDELWDKGLKEGDHFNYSVVVGRRKAE